MKDGEEKDVEQDYLRSGRFEAEFVKREDGFLPVLIVSTAYNSETAELTLQVKWNVKALSPELVRLVLHAAAKSANEGRIEMSNQGCRCPNHDTPVN